MLFNEPKLLKLTVRPPGTFRPTRFSALQRAEIAEIGGVHRRGGRLGHVSVLFNEPKLLKSGGFGERSPTFICFSALQRAEIAEILTFDVQFVLHTVFQCSSTSRNC